MIVIIVTAVLIFIPARFFSYFGLEPFARVYRGWISLSFLVAATILVLRLVSLGWERVGFSRHQKAVRGHLENLGTDQINVLLQYVQSGKNSITWPPSNGAVRDLENKGILYRSSDMGHLISGFPYSVTPAAARYLRPKAFQSLLLKSAKKQAE